MSSKSSIALVGAALVFLAFWGVALASVNSGPISVDADGYGIYQSSKL